MRFSHLSERHQVEYRSANYYPTWRIRWNAQNSFWILDTILPWLGLRAAVGIKYSMNAYMWQNIRVRFSHLSERHQTECVSANYNPEWRARWSAPSSFYILDTIHPELGVGTMSEMKHNMNTRVSSNISERFYNLREWYQIESPHFSSFRTLLKRRTQSYPINVLLALIYSR